MEAGVDLAWFGWLEVLLLWRFSLAWVKTCSDCSIIKVKQCPALFTELVTMQSRKPITRTNHKNVTVNRIPAAINAYSRICMVRLFLDYHLRIGSLGCLHNFSAFVLCNLVQWFWHTKLWPLEVEQQKIQRYFLEGLGVQAELEKVDTLGQFVGPFFHTWRFQNFAFCVVFGNCFLLFSFRPKDSLTLVQSGQFFDFGPTVFKIYPFLSWFLVWGA